MRVTFLYLLLLPFRREPPSATESPLDISKFSVNVHPNVIARLKEQPEVAECLEAGSDTESVGSGVRNEDPGLPLNELLPVSLLGYSLPVDGQHQLPVHITVACIYSYQYVW